MRLTSNKAFDLILSGQAPDRLVVEGDLDFTHCSQPIVLPKGLFVGGSLTLTGANVTELPDDLDVMFHVHANRCLELARIGRGVKAGSLDLSDSRALRAIAHPVRVKHDLVLERCTALERLTLTGRVGYLRLSGCSRLAEIRGTLRADTVDVRGCSALRALATDKVRTVIVDERTAMPYAYREHQVQRDTALHWIAIGRARDGLRVSESIELGKHVQVETLPDPLIVHGDLDLRGVRLRRLPRVVHARGRIDLSDARDATSIPPDWRADTVILASGPMKPAGKSPVGKSGSVRAIFKVLGMLWYVCWSRAAAGEKPHWSGLRGSEALAAIRRRDASVSVVGGLDLKDIRDLDRLPASLSVEGRLVLQNNERLQALPAHLRVSMDLSVSGCAALTTMPERLAVESLELYGCHGLTTLPPISCKQLRISHCDGLEWIPDHVVVTHTISIDNCKSLRQLPAEMAVLERVTLSALPALSELPARLAAQHLVLQTLPQIGELPAHTTFTSLEVSDMPALERLPARLDATYLTVSKCPRLPALPTQMRVSTALTVQSCPQIRTLPDQLTPSVLICEDNSDLVSLPASLRTMRQLTLRRCPAVEALPEHLTRVERLEVPHCSRLRALPPRLRVTETLNVYQCEALTALPERMGAPHRAEIGRSGLTGLPAGWEVVALTWDRVVVTPQMIFQTAALSPVEVLTEPNAEIRRILIERFGVTRLLREADATILDRDTDAGGVRELLSVPLPNGEPPLVGLKVRCPSTGRIFHLRVPPWMRTCHAAAAWLAGFDNPADYAPILET